MKRLTDMERFAHQVANCEAKAAFKTRGQALIYAGNRMSREPTKGKPKSHLGRLWAYSCPICADWHLTSKPSVGMAVEPARHIQPVGGRRREVIA